MPWLARWYSTGAVVNPPPYWLVSSRLAVRRPRCVLCADRGVASQEVEITPFVGLLHVVEEEATVAASEPRGSRLPRRAAPRELRVADPQGQPARRDVELNLVAVTDQRQGAAHCRLGRDVEDHRAVRG